jgi:MFS transporter, UMF1 family
MAAPDVLDQAPPTFSEATTLQKISWALCDWANSGYGLIVVGPVFSPYFINALLPKLPGKEDHGLQLGGITMPGSAVMGLLTSVSMLLMALGAPVLGAVADIKGWTKRLLAVFTVLGSLLTMLMLLLRDGAWGWGAVLFVTSNFCFGTAFAFYNAFLPRLTRPEKQGSLSGWGFAAGYIGGALALILVLMMITADPRYVRHGLALSGAWWLVFTLPAIFFLKELPPQATEADRGPAVAAAWRRIVSTFKNIKKYRNLFIFLLAFLLYNDGVETVISMSAPYGTDVLKMTTEQLIKMFLIVQFVAFGGALGFGYLADRIGNKAVILINLVVWVAAATLAFFIRTPGQFTALGVVVGLVLGGVQASSRALMGMLAPEHIRNEAFGFFSISGKFASIFGPLLYTGLATALGARYGILSVLPFLVAGLIVLVKVREPRGAEGAQTT